MISSPGPMWRWRDSAPVGPCSAKVTSCFQLSTHNWWRACNPFGLTFVIQIAGTFSWTRIFSSYFSQKILCNSYAVNYQKFPQGTTYGNLFKSWWWAKVALCLEISIIQGTIPVSHYTTPIFLFSVHLLLIYSRP
jgi:hypothetical protein